jgi:hypothetical protein
MTFRRLLTVGLLSLAFANEARAQDSSRTDWREWFAVRDSVARCRAYPMLMQFIGPSGEWTTHRTPAGGTCQAGPGPAEPTAWVIDSVPFCPDSSPASWEGMPRMAPRVDERNLVNLEVTQDSVLLRSLRCAIRPRGAVLIRTRRP